MRLKKARTAFNMLKKAWNDKEISKSTKIKIFKSVIVYRAETRRTTTKSDKHLLTDLLEEHSKFSGQFAFQTTTSSRILNKFHLPHRLESKSGPK